MHSRWHDPICVTMVLLVTACASNSIGIDAKAPIISRQTIYIDAPVHRVWALQVDLANWPSWRPQFEYARLDGKLAVGTTLRWRRKGSEELAATIRQVIPDRRIVWQGTASGINAIHVWTFKPARDGVIVSTEESWTGSTDVQGAQVRLDASLKQWLAELKRRAEAAR